MKQRTEEWQTARRGCVTASRVADILPGARGYKASRETYITELLCERLTGTQQENFVSAAMQWGIDKEAAARDAFEAKFGVMVDEVGFIKHPEIAGFGASPDGLCELDGEAVGIEIKCPNSTNHLLTLTDKKWRPEYTIQMHVGMMCCGLDKWIYVSFDPRMPTGLQFFSQAVPRDPALCSQIEKEVRIFLAELDAKEIQLRELINERT